MSKYCIELKNVSYAYPDELNKNILNRISFKLKEGEILGIMGPNGSGKTTLINLIAGFIKPSFGNIIYRNKNKLVFSSLVFQENSLLDWKSAFENVELSLLNVVKEKTGRNELVNNMLDLVNILEHKHKLPKQLSGGLKQRTVIARALAPNPSLLLLDEPFSALDVISKRRLLEDLKQILLKEKKSTIMVTHSVEEAIFLCDKILLLDPKNCKIEEVLKIEKPRSKVKDLQNDSYFLNLKKMLMDKIEVLRE